MARYIVCHRKRNTPRVDIRICERKCPYRNQCEDFIATRQTPSASASIAPENDPTGLKLEAA